MKIQFIRPLTKRAVRERAILRKYWILGDHTKGMQETCMCWGLDCGEGWFDIIEQLCQDIERLIETKYPEMKTEEYPFRVSQVKEKLGGLSFYYWSGNDEIRKLVREAEDKCSKTCEVCGNKGKLRDDGWLRTLCAKCWKVRKSESKKT